MSLILLCLLAFGSIVTARFTSLEFSDCNDNIHSPATISMVNITPMPAIVPGNIYLSADMALTRPVGPSSMELSIKRKGYFFDFPIPCMFRVGSCKYENVCTMVDEMIKEDWAGIMGNIGNQIKDLMTSHGVTYNQCPQPARTLSIRNYLIRMPQIPAILSWFASGDYNANIRVREHATGMQLLCINMNLSINNACSGLRCIWGK